jgi:hypothetical protein
VNFQQFLAVAQPQTHQHRGQINLLAVFSLARLLSV